MVDGTMRVLVERAPFVEVVPEAAELHHVARVARADGRGGIAADVERGKPHPDMFLLAAERCGVGYSASEVALRSRALRDRRDQSPM